MGYMDLQRFAEDTRHMIIFDVLTNDSPVGWKGETKPACSLSDTGYEKALDSQEKGQIKILSHAKYVRAICTMTVLTSYAKGGRYEALSSAAAGGSALAKKRDSLQTSWKGGEKMQEEVETEL